jgi:1-pyrroline-5-carboxylate dehydrogenase
MSGPLSFPEPKNERIRTYAPGTEERATLKAALAKASAEVADVPLWIAGERPKTASVKDIVAPHNRHKVVGHYFQADKADIERAVRAAEAAKREWAAMGLAERASIFMRAADLLAGPFRDKMNTATMLGQSKTAHQAEIDSACELIDFLRFNVYFAAQIAERSQPISPPGVWNRVELRPLDGFIFAVTPFNFTAIAGNLPTAPAILGNTVVWKPASSQMLSAGVIIEVLEAAGLPPGVINMVQGPASMLSQTVTKSPRLGGIHFTGSTSVFQELWSMVGSNIQSYAQYPRLVGETGGKDFIFAHPSANIDALVTAIVRGGFEFQGQKCSAASRVYVPRSLAKKVKERAVAEIQTIEVGDVSDFSCFMGAVIDEKAFDKITGYIARAKSDAECAILAGGKSNKEIGWFIDPTLVETRNPRHAMMSEEIFGPVVTLWVYEDQKLDEALDLCDTATPYALTGAIFADDRRAIEAMSGRLVGAAGNFYINDKPTGAVVGQQPFGGSRASGTNDKAGSAWNLMRWISPRVIKETFVPPTSYRYPFMQAP